MEGLSILFAQAVAAGYGELALFLMFTGYVLTKGIKTKLSVRKKAEHYDIVMKADEQAANHCDFIRTLVSADRCYILEFRNGSVNVAGHSLLRMYMKYPESLSFDTNSIYANMQGTPLRLFYDWVMELKEGNVVSIPNSETLKTTHPDRYNLFSAHGTDSLYLFPLRSTKNNRYFGAGAIGFCNGATTLTAAQLATVQHEFNNLVLMLDKSL